MRLFFYAICCLGAVLLASCTTTHSADNRYLNGVVVAKEYKLPQKWQRKQDFPVSGKAPVLHTRPSVIPPRIAALQPKKQAKEA